MAIANALQLEAAGATPALFCFNYDTMQCLKSLNRSNCYIIAFCCWHITLRCVLDIWPLTLNICNVSPVTCTKFKRNPRRSCCDFNSWPNDLVRHVTCSTRFWDDFHRVWHSTTYLCLNYCVFFSLIRYVTLCPWPLARWPWKIVVHQATRDQSLYEIWAKSSYPRLNYCYFFANFCTRCVTLWVWPFTSWP